MSLSMPSCLVAWIYKNIDTSFLRSFASAWTDLYKKIGKDISQTAPNLRGISYIISILGSPYSTFDEWWKERVFVPLYSKIMSDANVNLLFEEEPTKMFLGYNGCHSLFAHYS